jgi:hypothetical protein
VLSTQTLHSLKLNAKQIPLDHDHDHDQIQDEDLVNQFTGGVFFLSLFNLSLPCWQKYQQQSQHKRQALSRK